MKIHFVFDNIHGCAHSYRAGVKSNDDIREVTCKSCKKFILKRGLKSRDEIPVDELGRPHFKAKREWSDGQLSFIVKCPICGEEHYHGGGRDPENIDQMLGERLSHCSCWDAYVLE